MRPTPGQAWRPVVVAVALWLLAAGHALAGTVLLNVVADATLDSAVPGVNQGSALELSAGWQGPPGERSRRIILDFDLAALPANALIESAFLELEPTAPGVDGAVARIAEPWIEDAVTWADQPAYTGPLVAPTLADPARWDVTALLLAWHSGQLPGYGLALLETLDQPAEARYASRESGAGARLVVTFALDVPDEPQSPPGSGAPTFSVDPTVDAVGVALPAIVAGGAEYARPLAALQIADDAPFSFVAGEVILEPADAAELEGLLDAWGGTVLRAPGLPDAPPELAEQVRPVPPDNAWLIRIDPDVVNVAAIDADAAEYGLLGEQRVSSDLGLRTIALVLRESVAGRTLSLNLAGDVTQAFPPLGLEEQAGTGGFEDPINDTVAYPEHDDGGNNFAGTNRAWQYLAFSRRSGPVDLAVIDSGFCLQPDGSRCLDAGGNPNVDMPASFFQYDFNDLDYNASGNSLDPDGHAPHHASGTVSIATAVHDNRYGIAGTGYPVARPIMFRVAIEVFQLASAIRTSVKWGAQVVNMSWIAECDSGCRFFSGFSGYGKLKDALQLAEANGVITVAAAGNWNVDLDDNFFIPCVLRWTTLCVGGLARNSTAKDSASNYGTNSVSPIGPGGVRIWAPGDSVRVGPDRVRSANHDVSGTSIASPFVAGALALALGVDPTLTAKQVQNLVFATRRASSDPLVAAGTIDVKKLVQAAGPPRDDALGNHGSATLAAVVTASGLDDLTLRRGEDDVFRFLADAYYDRVTFRARYVEALGDLRSDGVGGTVLASTHKVSGVGSTTFDGVTADLCVGEDAYARVRGVNAAVGNGYRLELVAAAAGKLAEDGNEPNDSEQAATTTTAPRESSLDLFNAERIDCRAGLTLDTAADVDHYAFSVAPGDLDADFAGVSARLTSDFPLSAKLYRDGALLLSQTGTSVELEDDTASAGAYRLEVGGSGLNAYTLRTRVYDPDARMRGFALEDWLKNAFLIAPDEFLPQCGGGCPPLPPFLAGYPFDPQTRFALDANGVTPVDGDSGFDFPLGGGPRFLALGAVAPGVLRVTLELPGVAAAATSSGDVVNALYAVLQDAAGNEVWRADGLTDATVLEAELIPGRSYFLTLNGQGSAVAGVNLELPRTDSRHMIPALPLAAALTLLLALVGLGARKGTGRRFI